MKKISMMLLSIALIFTSSVYSFAANAKEKKMCKKIRKTFITVLILLVMAGCASSTVFALEKIEVKDEVIVRRDVMFQTIINSWDNEAEIQNVKQITDFAGNPYVVVECSPTGYIIYNSKAGIIMEEAEMSASPYLGVKSGIYGGPAQYFKIDIATGVVEHTITGVVLDQSQIEAGIETCQSAQTVLARSVEKEVLNSADINEDTFNNMPLATVTNTYIGNHKAFFTNLSTKEKMGYWSINNGACGYVAAGIVLLYYDKYLNSSFINNTKYLNSNGDAFTGGSFTKHLYYDIGVAKLGYGSTTSASQVAKIMTTYLKDERGITATCWSTVTPKVDSIIYQLKNRNIPVIYVDRFNDPRTSGETTDHDIVVYGYDNNNKLITHFGWVGYTHVKCSSPALAAFVSSACAITYY